MADQITKSVVVAAEPERIFRVLADFNQYKNFISGIQSVEQSGTNITRWKISGPFGRPFEFDLETTKFDPNMRIGVNTKDLNENMSASGQVVLAPLPDQQTEVTVTLNYDVKGISGLLAGSIDKEVDRGMRNFKAYVEGMHDRIDR
jgi:uncharacterized membrane protein